MLAPGHKIGPYTVHECAGEGGMARVYKVWHDGLHRFEAMKTPRGNTSADGAYVSRLLAEARVAAGLYHPNIVGIHNVSDSGTEVPFFTMDWVEGRDLAKVMAERGPFSLEETIEILEPVASALDYAHEHRVVHRDVKPANILLGEVRGTLVPRVVDFGISRAAEDDDEGATKLTKSGMLVGTPEYMSPEQSGSGAPVDYRTDIYSLGVVAFEMLCGRPPFTAGEGVSRLSILISHVRDTAPLWDHVPHFPRYSGEVLLRALSKAPHERYPDCRTFVAELKRAAQADGPFTAFVYDENGQRTPFDASRFAPIDAATLAEKPGATAEITQPTRTVPESAPTRLNGSGDTFLSLGARLNAQDAEAPAESSPLTTDTLSPKAKILARDASPSSGSVGIQAPKQEAAIPSTTANPSLTPGRLEREIRSETPAIRRSAMPSAAIIAVLGTCLMGGGLAWFLSGRVSKAVKTAAQTSTISRPKVKPDVEVAKSPNTEPAPKPAAPTQKFKTLLVTIPFEKKERRVDTKPVSYKKIVQVGVAGQKRRQWRLTLQGSKRISTETLPETLILAPKDEITEVGTLPLATTKKARETSRPRVRRRPVVERAKVERPKPKVTRRPAKAAAPKKRRVSTPRRPSGRGQAPLPP